MTNSSLKVKLAQLAQIPGEPPAAFGFAVDIVLERESGTKHFESIRAIQALTRAHVPLATAKRAVEEAMRGGQIVVHVPVVEDLSELILVLAQCRFVGRRLTDDDTDLPQLRARLALTQDEFATRFGFEVDAIRNWEQGRRKPDRAARSYLSVINRAPDMVAAIFAGQPATTGLTDDRKVDAT